MGKPTVHESRAGWRNLAHDLTRDRDQWRARAEVAERERNWAKGGEEVYRQATANWRERAEAAEQALADANLDAQLAYDAAQEANNRVYAAEQIVQAARAFYVSLEDDGMVCACAETAPEPCPWCEFGAALAAGAEGV